jgi:hypothetical protein
MSGAIIPAGLPISFGSGGGGGGGGSTNVFAGDGIIVTGALGGPYTVAADFGAGALKVLEALKTSVETVLGFSVAGVVKATAIGVLSSALLVNADVDAAAAIAGTKVAPDFGAQNVVTTGTLGAGSTTVTALSIGALSGVVKASAGTISAASLVNADVDAAAAIAASKLNLTTIAQNIANTGTFANTGAVTITGAASTTTTLTAGTDDIATAV